MSILSGLFSNEKLIGIAFGKLREVFEEKNLEYIVLRLTPEGEIKADLYGKGEAVITLKVTEIINGNDNDKQTASADGSIITDTAAAVQ